MRQPLLLHQLTDGQSFLVCFHLQPQAVFIQKKIPQADRNNAIFVTTNFYVVAHDNDFPEGIRDAQKTTLFLPDFICRRKCKGRLDIIFLASPCGDKIYFQLQGCDLPARRCAANDHETDEREDTTCRTFSHLSPL